MTHTPTPWETRKAGHPVDGAYDWAIGAQVGDSAYCIGELVGRAAEDVWLPAEENANRAIACVNFFHGHDIDTDKIPEGGFWEMASKLFTAHVILESYGADEKFCKSIAELLSKLGVEP